MSSGFRNSAAVAAWDDSFQSKPAWARWPSGFRLVRVPTSPKQSSPPLENSTIKRLQSELKDLMLGECDSGISAFPENDSIMLWKGSITGGKGSVFEGKQYKISLRFPNDYPFKPPVVTFDLPAPFHPNVDYLLGKIYLDILLEQWSSAFGVRTVLLSIKAMLQDPNLSAPVNPAAARLWSDQKEYRKMVEKPPKYGPEMRNLDRFVGQSRSGEAPEAGFDVLGREEGSYAVRFEGGFDVRKRGFLPLGGHD